MSGISIVKQHRRSDVPTLMKGGVPLTAAAGACLLCSASSEHNFGRHSAGERQAHLVGHVGLPQKWIRPPKPEIIGQGKLAQFRLLRNKSIVTISADMSRTIATKHGCIDAALV